MVAHVGSESGVTRRMLISFFVVTLIALVLRAAAAAPGLVASVAAVVSIVALVIGLSSRGRAPHWRWRRSWALLAVALVGLSVVTTQQAVAGLPRTFPATGDWIGIACEGAVLLALCGLLSMRS